MDGATKGPDCTSADDGLLSLRLLGLLVGGGPSRRHQFGDSAVRPVASELGHHVAQVGEGVHASQGAVAEHGANDRVAAGTFVRAAEEIVPPPKSRLAMSALDVQVVDGNSPVGRETRSASATG
jgi:hypothetical protein